MTAAPTFQEVPNRALLTGTLMLAVFMQTLDSTIANVALPHMQGSLQAAQDQVTWILTSYIIAAAVITPVTPWLAGRFGRKRLLLVSVAGFTLASLLCGLAQSLSQMVLFRCVQGVFGASLMPLAQAIMLDINPPERHGRAMSQFAMATVVAPILGPALGGWLTDNYSWRWVFLINLPGGILCLVGAWLFLHDHAAREKRSFDVFGFLTLAVALGSIQLMLDRGAGEDWFQSTEIWIELLLGLTAGYLFVIHTMTAVRPFLDRALARDRNFVTSTVAGFFIMGGLFSVLALVPPFLQSLMGYPVITSGLVTSPRGLGMFLIMPFVGRMIGRIDTRIIVGSGLLMNAAVLYVMSRFTLQMDSSLIIWTSLLQGAAVGLMLVPLTTLAFATLSPALRTEGSAVFNLTRNIGGAVGISVMQALWLSNAAKVHAALVAHITPENPVIQGLPKAFGFDSPVGPSLLNALATKQAMMIGFISDFRIMTWVTLAVIPLLLLLRSPRHRLEKTDVILD